MSTVITLSYLLTDYYGNIIIVIIFEQGPQCYFYLLTSSFNGVCVKSIVKWQQQQQQAPINVIIHP